MTRIADMLKAQMETNERRRILREKKFICDRCSTKWSIDFKCDRCSGYQEINDEWDDVCQNCCRCAGT